MARWRYYSTSPVQASGPVGGRAVSVGQDHSLAVNIAGSVSTWGYNGSGQLGDGTTTNRTTPTVLSGLSGVIGVGAGWSHSAAVTSSGIVYSWGANSYGQLGDGTTTGRLSPVAISGLTGVIDVSAGGNHTLALKSDGTVWAWGYNYFGQLGDGSMTDSHVPVQVTGLNGVTAISAGYVSSVALRSDGTVWAWGSNSSGQLGNGYSAINMLAIPTLIDTSPPTGSVAIDGGAEYTTGPSVTISLAADDDSGTVCDMQISGDGVFDAEPWEPFSATAAWTLAGDDGLKTVYARFRDPSGNVSDTVAAMIDLDTLPPVIQSVTVTPAMAAVGDALDMRVDVVDGGGVASVSADGVDLIRSTIGSWTGQVTAISPIGVHWVSVTARDVGGHSTSDTSADYRTAAVLGLGGEHADEPVISLARTTLLFKLWGRVTTIDSHSFRLDDGSGCPVKVVAPGYSGIATGDYAFAYGILDPAASPPTLSAPAATVVKLD